MWVKVWSVLKLHIMNVVVITILINKEKKTINGKNNKQL